MVRISFEASALKGKLDKAPEDLRKKVKEAMAISVRDVQERARKQHRFTSRTGDAEGSIKVSLMGRNEHLVGTVYTALPHAVYQHQGTRAHDIVPRSKQALRWSGGKDLFIFAKRSHVAGIKADPYIFNAFEEEKPAIISRFKELTEGVL